jgi:hypothetical protein
MLAVITSSMLQWVQPLSHPRPPDSQGSRHATRNLGVQLGTARQAARALHPQCERGAMHCRSVCSSWNCGVLRRWSDTGRNATYAHQAGMHDNQCISHSVACGLHSAACAVIEEL